MNEYLVRETNEHVQHWQLGALFPSVYFGPEPTAEYLDPIGIDVVVPTGAPIATTFQTVERDGIEQVDGQWKQKWKTIDWTVEQTNAYISSSKFAKWEAIKLERDRRETGGVKVGEKWFHTDEGSRIKQLGLAIAGASIPADLQWKTMDGSFITMTPTLAKQVFETSLAKTSEIFIAAEQHRALMEAYADPASYDFSSGWPDIYEY